MVTYTDERPLTVQEAAELVRVSKKTIYRWIEARKLPGVYRIGKIWLIPKSALEAAVVTAL